MQQDYENSMMLDAETTIKIYNTRSLTLRNLKYCSDVLFLAFLFDCRKNIPTRFISLRGLFSRLHVNYKEGLCTTWASVLLSRYVFIPVSRSHRFSEFLLFPIFNSLSFFAWIMNFKLLNIPQLQQYFYLG